MTLVKRLVKGSALTAAEHDGNMDHVLEMDNMVEGTLTKVLTADERTKLANIEALADVTDTENVTAAGALMDSEVTNLAAVKAFDPTDYATAAQGSTADTALQPTDIASGTITARTGAINFSGGTDGDVLTVQADGSLAPEAPSAATVNVDQYDIVARIAAGNGAAGGLAAADLTEEETPATGDFLLGWESGGALRKFDVGDLPSGGGSGTVTSVAVSGSDGIEVDSGSPITSSGTIALGVNAATMKAFLDLEAGTDFYSIAAADAAFQPLDADLTALAALTSPATTLTGALQADGGRALLVDTDEEPVTHSSAGNPIDLSTTTQNEIRVTLTASATQITPPSDLPTTGDVRDVRITLVQDVAGGHTITSLVGDANVTLAPGTVVPTLDTTALAETSFWISARNNSASWTLEGNPIIPISQIEPTDLTGADGTLVTGTAGTNGDLAVWDGNGDLVDGPTPPTGAIVGTTDSQTLTNKNISDATNTYRAASTTVVGAVELADASEVTTGTSATLAVTPDALAGSDYGKRSVAIEVFDGSGAITTGDAKYRFPVPDWLAGFNVVGVELVTTAPSTSGVIGCALRRGRQASATTAPAFVDVLTTNVTIDQDEYHSKDATTPAAVNATNDDIAAGDVFAVDADNIGSGPTAQVHMIITCAKP